MLAILRCSKLPILLALLILCVSCAREPANSVSGRVVKIADGDTITVLDAQNVQHKIRLQGIDAPERKQDFGTVSREHLASLVFEKQVRVDYDKTDGYGRLVGKVWVDGADECLAQLKAGLAWHYKEYEREQSPADRQLYAAAEAEARLQKRGLWQDSQPIPPWDFRHHTNGSTADTESSDDSTPAVPADSRVAKKVSPKVAPPRPAPGLGETPAAPARVRVAPSARTEPSERTLPSERTQPSAQAPPVRAYSTVLAPGAVRGNRRSMIYHWPGCEDYDNIALHNRVPFPSRHAAEQAGYRPARNCH